MRLGSAHHDVDHGGDRRGATGWSHDNNPPHRLRRLGRPHWATGSCRAPTSLRPPVNAEAEGMRAPSSPTVRRISYSCSAGAATAPSARGSRLRPTTTRDSSYQGRKRTGGRQWSASPKSSGMSSSPRTGKASAPAQTLSSDDVVRTRGWRGHRPAAVRAPHRLLTVLAIGATGPSGGWRECQGLRKRLGDGLGEPDPALLAKSASGLFARVCGHSMRSRVYHARPRFSDPHNLSPE